MLVYKAVSGIAAIAFGAALVLALPGFSPEVEARTPPPVVKSDRLDVRPLGQECTQQAWPYYETNCLRHTSRPDGQTRPVRVILHTRASH